MVQVRLMSFKGMNISPSLIKKKGYLPPCLTVVDYKVNLVLLVASNEGLEYEDLLSPQVNCCDEEVICIDEEVFPVLL